MLRASLLTDAKILPQARQGNYFFNSIGQKRSLTDYKILADADCCIWFWGEV